MYLLFFLLWIIFNGQLTLEIAIFGILCSGLIYSFICYFMNWSPSKDKLLLRMSFFLMHYIAVLLWEIIKANGATIRLIFSTRYEREPVLVSFQTPLKHPFCRVLLANSITLTPGTITVSLENDYITVHALDRDFIQGIEDSVFIQMLQRAERILSDYE